MSTHPSRHAPHGAAAGGTETRPARETVAVTGAGGQVGQALLRAFAPDIRRTALVRPNVHVPAECVVAGRLDSPHAGEALRQADVVVHLSGGLRAGQGASLREANLATATWVAAAVREGRARRLVFLSCVGADRSSRNEYLALKAEAEDVLAGTGKDLVVFRCAHIIGPPEAPGPTAEALLCREAQPVTVLGSGTQRVAPIYLGDVVSAIVAATRGGPPGIYELVGPQELDLDGLVRMLNRSWFTPLRHVPGPLARVLGEVVPGLPAPLVDLMLRDSAGDSRPACRAFGLTLTPLGAVWR